jgi:hypothetical protein
MSCAAVQTEVTPVHARSAASSRHAERRASGEAGMNQGNAEWILGGGATIEENEKRRRHRQSDLTEEQGK